MKRSVMANLIKFSLLGKNFAFDADGTINFLPNDYILYVSKGTVLPQVNGNYLNPPVANKVTLPDLDKFPQASARIGVTEWVLSSALWAVGQTGLLDITITPSMLPATSPLKLSTDDSFWKATMPGLSTYPHMNLTVSFAPNSPWPVVSTLTNNTITIDTSLSLTFNIVNGAEVVVPAAAVINVKLFVTLHVAVSLVNPAVVSVLPTITNETNEVTLTSSKIGDVTLKTLKSIIALAFGFVKIPAIQVPIPDPFHLSSISITSFPGYLVASANFGNTSMASHPRREN